MPWEKRFPCLIRYSLTYLVRIGNKEIYNVKERESKKIRVERERNRKRKKERDKERDKERER